MTDASTIVSRAFANLYGFSSLQVIEIRSTGGIPMTSRVARQAGALDKVLSRSQKPYRGSGMLIIEGPEHVYHSWLYNKKERREDPFRWHRNENMVGTDLWYEDTLPKRAKDWEAGDAQKVDLDSRRSWRVRITPRSVPSAYEFADVWFDQEKPIILAASFHLSGKVVRTLEVEPALVKEVKGHFVPTRLTFRRGNSETVVTVSKIEIRRFEDSLFTTEDLRNEGKP
jgi:hypothetical protein